MHRFTRPRAARVQAFVFPRRGTQVLPESFGFRKEDSVGSAILIIRIVMEQFGALSPSLDVERILTTMADIEKACDRIVRELVYAVNARIGIPESLNKVVRGLYDGAIYFLRTIEGDCDDFTLGRGFKQGCPSAPSQFNIVHGNAMHDFKQKAQRDCGELGIGFVWSGHTSDLVTKERQKQSQRAGTAVNTRSIRICRPNASSR